MRRFLGKELRELVRTGKGVVVLSVFLAFGLASPIVAKLMPALVEKILSSMPGAVFEIPQPTAFDAYRQYLKNMYQIGMVVMILIAMGTVAEEKANKSLVVLLTMQVSRTGIIVAKYLGYAILLGLGLVLGAAACALYTHFLFGETLIGRLAPAVLVLYLDNLLLLATVLFFSAVAPRPVFAGLGGFGIYLLLSAAGFVFQSQAVIVPGQNAGLAGFLIDGGRHFPEALPAIGVTLGLTMVVLLATVWIFRRQEL
jgi:ABC-2 type transport system permease protein